ncbi:hypothetical protein MMC30_003119 [Trapelia coarctata]|nr:hypothetical protein [Trapelia coarctata]
MGVARLEGLAVRPAAAMLVKAAAVLNIATNWRQNSAARMARARKGIHAVSMNAGSTDHGTCANNFAGTHHGCGAQLNTNASQQTSKVHHWKEDPSVQQSDHEEHVRRHLGIKKYLGQVSQEIQLTKSKADQQANRDIMCPDGFCADGIKEYIKAFPDVDPADLVVASGMSCDEFPFASTTQGGNLNKGTRICLEGWENSWQGGKMSRKLSALADGDDFKIIIKGWDCDKQAPVKRSLEAPEPLEKRAEWSEFDDSLAGDDLYYNFTDSGQHAMILSLGDLQPGTYTYSLTLTSGTVAEAYVVDYLGDEYGAAATDLTPGNTTHFISFTLDSAAVGVGLVALTTDRTLQMQYQVNGTVPPPSASTAAATASATSSVSAAAAIIAVGWKGVTIVVAGGVLGLTAVLGIW